MTATQARRPTSPVEAAAREWVDGAIVTVRWPNGPDDRPMERFAVFVFGLPRGRVVWVEGSYADPWGWPMPTGHEMTRAREVAPLWSVGPAFEGTAGRGAWVATVEPYRRGLRANIDRVLTWFDGYLRDKGRTWDEERAQVRLSLDGGQ